MYCTICGENNQDGSSFCSGCGNNLQQKSNIMKPGQTNEQVVDQRPGVVQYKPIEFKVNQKLFAFRSTYKISNALGHEFMVVKKKFINPFRPYLYVEQPNGTSMGHIQGNLWRTQWEIFDEHNNLHATIRMPLFMMFRKNFTIETADGIYQSGNSIFAYKFDAYAPNGQIALLVDKKILSIRDSFQIKTFGSLNPYVSCLAAVIIDQKFHSKGSGGGGFGFGGFGG